MKKKIFTLLLAVAAGAGTLFASYTQVNGIWYDFDSSSKSATVTYRGSAYYDYSEYTGLVAIPASVIYNNVMYSVTSIGGSAFAGCTALTSITIPNSVTSIGGSAFSGCKGLTSVTIPNRVTSIGSSAFYGCSGLTSITIPNSVTSIGDYAFCDCYRLTSVTIGNSVTSIGEQAFYKCTGLTSVTIGNSVTSIRDEAFRYCYNLSSVTIPNSVTSIGYAAFCDCYGLTSVTIGNSVTSIGDYAFSGCSELKSVHINDLAAWCAISFYNLTSTPLYYAEHLYINDTEVTDLVIPNNVTSIGKGAFSSCTGLTSVTIPNSVTSIGSYAFSGCTYLKSVTIGNSVTSIGSYAFNFCSRLTSVTIPNSVTSIGDYAFDHCSSLTSVTIPNSVTSIGSYAFSRCKSLTSITIPNSVTSIGESAFYDIPNIVYSGNAIGSPWGAKNVNGYVEGYLIFSDDTKTNLLACSVVAKGEIIIPNSVTSIGKCAFSSCTGLTSVTIPNSVTSIGDSAFYKCTALTSVTIGNSVTSIGSYAFYGCTYLKSVTIGNSVTNIGNYAFSECPNITSVIWNAKNCNNWNFGNQVESFVFGDSVEVIPDKLCAGMNKLTSITIPGSVASIGEDAFKDCSELRSVHINDLAAWCKIKFSNKESNPAETLYLNDSKIIDLVIPNSVTSIGNYAFCNCYDLTSVTIPNSVTSIGESAFYACYGLTSVTCEATIPPTYGKSAFSSKKFPLYVPSNSVSAYKTANEWRDFLIIRAIGSDTTFTCAEASETAFRYAINGNSSAKVSIVGYVTNIAEEWSYRYANISFWMADTKGGGKVLEAFRVKCDTQEEAPVVGDKVKVYGCLTVYDEKIPEIAVGGTFEILERADGIPVQADEINNNEVKATPTDDGSVVITWPEVEGATSYTIDIRKKGELICTLVFNSNGQLISIKFAAPSCNGNRRDVAAATQAKKGWSYTITGMESGATYTYSVTAKNDSGTKLFEQSIEYTMPAVQGIVDIDASANQSGIHKFIKNGQLYIQRGNELFNAQGARVK